MSRDADTYLYVLKLEPEKDPAAKWYVGITDDYERRFKQHHNGRGSNWTRRNKIVDSYAIGKETRRNAKRIENHLTAFLMQEFGSHTTRGGDYLGIWPLNLPDVGDILLPPKVGELLLSSGSPELARAARGNIGVRLHVNEPVKFESVDDALLWADEELPEGTSLSIEKPCWGRVGNFEAYAEPEPEDEL